MTQSQRLKSVVVCADDYAVNAPTSQGIVALSVLGRLSATSVMVHSPRWPQDAPALRDVRERIDVGLHLDWTSSFAQVQGFGQPLAPVMVRSLLGRFDRNRVIDEVQRQLDAFEAHWQAPPDHVDGHQHVQQFAGVREALCEVLLRRYGNQTPRPWLRVSQVAQPGLKAQVITAMGAQALGRWTQQHSWPSVAPLLGVYGFDGGLNVYRQHMQRWLSQVPVDAPPALIMCHPAALAHTDDEIGPARAIEFAYLASHDFVQDLQDAAVGLVRGNGQSLPVMSHLP
jgi:predicted glycoside hydrolase/deacetylase ChbG (UPF0249 family)